VHDASLPKKRDLAAGMTTSETRQRAGRSFTGQMFSFGIAHLIIRLRSLITLPILTRLVGAEGYGLLALLTTLVTLAQMVIVPGVGTALKVFIPGSPPEQRRRDFWGIFQVTLILGAIAVALLAALYPFFQRTLLPSEMTIELYIAGIVIIPASTLQLVLFAQIMNNKEGRAYSRIAIITSIIEVLLLLAGAYSFGVVGVLYAMAVAKLVLCAMMLRVIRANDAFAWLKTSYLPEIRKYYTYGFTIFVAGLGAWVVASSDRFVIGKYLGAGELGTYQVAYGLCSYLNELAMPVFAPLMPFIAELINSGSTDEARHYLRQSQRLLLFVFVPAVVLLSFTVRDVLAMLTTEEFLLGASIVPFVATGIALFHVGGIYNYNLIAHKRGHVLIYSTFCGAVVNLVLNLLLIPVYGLMAAAVSTLLAYVTIVLMDRHFSRQSLIIGLERIFWLKLAATTIGMSVPLLFLQSATKNAMPVIRFAVMVLTGGSTYLALGLWLRVITPEELKRLYMAGKMALVPSRSRQTVAGAIEKQCDHR